MVKTKYGIDLSDDSIDEAIQRLDSEKEINANFNISSESVVQKVHFPACDAMAKEKYASERIISSICYLQTFFKVKDNKKKSKKLWRVILQVLEDVQSYFLSLHTMGKVDLIQKAFVSYISNDQQNPTSDSPVKEMFLLSQQEKELLYFCYTANFCERQNYSTLFDTYFSPNKLISNSEKLSYFQKFDNFFVVDKEGVVKSRPLVDLHLLPSFSPYIFKPHDVFPSLLLRNKTVIPKNTDMKNLIKINTRTTVVAQNNEWWKDNLMYKKLCSAVLFLLHSFEQLSQRLFIKCIFYVFPDIRLCVNELSIENQRKIFSSIACTVLNNNNNLELETSYEIDVKYISESKILLLYIVSYLALHGKTHFSKVLEELYHCVPQGTIRIFRDAKDPRWNGYLEASPFVLDSLGVLTLAASFEQTALDAPDLLSQSDISLCNDDSPLATEEDTFSVELQSSEQCGNTINGFSAIDKKTDEVDCKNDLLKDSNLINSPYCRNDNQIPLSKIMTLSHSETFFAAEIKKGISCETTNAEKIPVLQFVAPNESNTNITPNPIENTSLKSKEDNLIPIIELGDSKSTLSNTIPYPELCEQSGETFTLELIRTETKQVNKNLNYSQPENFSFCNRLFSEETVNSLTNSRDSVIQNVANQNWASHSLVNTDRIHVMLINGIDYLLKNFKCTPGIHLACVALHVLHETKQLFLSLSYSNQMELIRKIIDHCRAEDLGSSLDTCETSLHKFELNNEQKNLLFISYILSLSEKMFYSLLLQKLDEHDIHIPEFIPADAYFKKRGTMFSMDGKGCIKLIDFPPVQWMSKYLPLSSVSSIGKSGTSKTSSINGKRIGPKEISFVKLSRPTKEMNTKNTSGYPQDMLNCLSEKLHDGIVCLLQNFEVFLNSGILEAVLHSVKNCALFFGLPYSQQKEVVRASFRPFHIDGQRRLIISEAATQKSKLTKREKELLCMSYIIIQNGALHYRQILLNFRKKIKTKGTDELGYFRKRQDLFFVDDRGYVNLFNVPVIRWHYVNFIMSEKVGSSNKISKLEILNSNRENMSQNEHDSSWSSKGRINEEISHMQVDKSGRKENIYSVKFLKEKTKIQKEKGLVEVKRMTDRIRNAISYLSQYFVLTANTDLLHLILSMLEDVKNYYLNLTAESRVNFKKECFSLYYISSRGFILSATLSKSYMLSDEEKIKLLNVYELSNQRKLYTKMFESFPLYSVTKSTSMENAKEKEVTKGFTVLKSGISDIKTNSFKKTKASSDVLTGPSLEEKLTKQLIENLPPQAPQVTTNLWESSYCGTTALSARKMNSPSFLHSQPFFFSECQPNVSLMAADASQANRTLNCGGCAALSWSAISIFEEDESYYNTLIDSFIGK